MSKTEKRQVKMSLKPWPRPYKNGLKADLKTGLEHYIVIKVNVITEFWFREDIKFRKQDRKNKRQNYALLLQ